jgi:hypothetical protein
VREQPGGDERAPDYGGTVHRDHPVLEILPDRQHEVVPTGHRHLVPGQRAEHLGRGPLAPVLADGHRNAGGAVAHHRQVGVVGETRFAVPFGLGQRDPQLQAVQHGRAARGRLFRVGDAAARGHQVQLARPDQLPAAEAVPVQHQALEQPADGLQADVRMGRDLHTGTPADLVRAVVVEEAPGADGTQRPLRQQPADLGAVADGRLAGLDHVYRVAHGGHAVISRATPGHRPASCPGIRRTLRSGLLTAGGESREISTIRASAGIGRGLGVA